MQSYTNALCLYTCLYLYLDLDLYSCVLSNVFYKLIHAYIDIYIERERDMFESGVVLLHIFLNRYSYSCKCEYLYVYKNHTGSERAWASKYATNFIPPFPHKWEFSKKISGANLSLAK